MSLFSLMFLAGFPDTYRQGSLAYAKKGGGDEVQKVVVTSYTPEQTSVNAVNFKNRKKMTVKEHTMEPVLFQHNCTDGSRIPLLLEVTHKMFLDNKGKTNPSILPSDQTLSPLEINYFKILQNIDSRNVLLYNA